MLKLQRNHGPRGPRFYQDDGKIWFIRVFDTNTREGPFVATLDHKNAFPEAWAAFERADNDAHRPLVTFSGEEPQADREKRLARETATSSRRAQAAS